MGCRKGDRRELKVLVMSDAHIFKCDSNNTYWCPTAVHGFDFWKRYLEVFDEVHVVARVKHLDTIDEKANIRADGPGVSFIELPFIRGARGYLKHFFSLSRLLKQVISDEECGIFRLPSLPTFMLLDQFKQYGRPYAIEVIIDPKDGYRYNKIAQFIMTRRLKKECYQANGVSYVTRDFLEKKYPSYSIVHGEDERHFDSYYSSINLQESFFFRDRTFGDFGEAPLRLIHVASAINSDIKGHTTLLKTVRKLKDENVNVTLSCVGDGDLRPHYEAMAAELGISDIVSFKGLFSKKEDLRNLLINSDLVVFPTQAEGLPRALIEAMAVGLPCLSTPVNGIPELLPPEYMFEPFDVNAFAEKIKALRANPAEMQKMSEENIKKAEEYVNSKLTLRRNEFYRKLANLAAKKQ